MPIVLLLAAVLTELLLWNFTSVVSLFYREVELEIGIEEEAAVIYQADSDTWLVPAGEFSVRIPDVNEKLHNLHLSMVPAAELAAGNKNSLSYVISLRDEGNYYAYDLPAQVIVEGVKATEYTNIYSYGKISDMTITFSAAENMVLHDMAIRGNVTIPLNLSPVRLLAGYLLLVVGWLLLSEKGLTQLCREGDKRQYLVTGLLLVVIILCSYRLATLNPVNVRPLWTHHNQYQELAELLLQGKVALLEKPSEKLVEAWNPYDTIWLQAQGIEYKADYAYYDGNYYIYFGIVPELLLYLPFYVIMGFHLPNYLAVFAFFSGFAVMVFALYREVIRRYFPDTPFLIYLLVSVMTVFVGSYTCMIADPDFYDVPIAAATMFTAAGLWLWIRALGRGGRRRGGLLLAGSLCMALVAGCRPQMLLYSALAIPLFYESVIRERTLFSRRGLKDTVLFCLPYVVVAMGAMYYNDIRFGSPFDFGAAYSLTSNDMTKRGFNLEQTMLGLYHYFLQLPLIRAVFPFIDRNPIETIYMGKLTTEYTYGGLLACNGFLWFMGYLPAAGRQLKDKKLFGLALTAIGASLVIAVVDTNYAGILQRYMSDFTWGIVLAAGILALAWAEKMLVAGGQAEKKQITGKVFLFLFIVQGAYSFFLLFGGGSYTNALESMAPQVFYRIAAWF